MNNKEQQLQEGSNWYREYVSPVFDLIFVLVVAVFATPFGAIAMFISARARARGHKLLDQVEAEKIREDEEIRQQVRLGPQRKSSVTQAEWIGSQARRIP